MESVDAAEEGEDAGALSNFDEDEELEAVLVELPLLSIAEGRAMEDEGKRVEEFVAELEGKRQAWKVLKSRRHRAMQISCG